MSAQSFQERIRRIEGRGHREVAPARVMHRSNNDQDRLVIALGLLKRNGIRIESSYPMVFKWLARSGVVLRPLHFWSLLGLTVLVFCGMSLILAAMVIGSIFLSKTPEPIALLLSGGPAVFLGLNFLVAAIYATAMKAHARRLGLPRWEDF